MVRSTLGEDLYILAHHGNTVKYNPSYLAFYGNSLVLLTYLILGDLVAVPSRMYALKRLFKHSNF